MLLVIFFILAFVLILFLWGGSLLLQGWLYQNPADMLPIRAVVGGAVLAIFLTLWCLLFANNPGKYDTLLEFTPIETVEYSSFDTVMKKVDGQEVIVKYTKRVGGKGGTVDFFDEKGLPWKKNTSESLAAAILIKEKDKEEPTRFSANLDSKGNFPKDVSDLRYTDESGRWVTVDSLGRINRKKTGVLFANIFLNALHFILWWVVMWLVLRFAVWHAFGLAFGLWLFMMLVIQPVLFNQVRPRETQTTMMKVHVADAGGIAGG